MTRKRIVAVFLAVVVAAGVAAAYARWTSTVDGTGAARSQGLAGSAPTAVAAGSDVTVSWAAAAFSDGTAATSYAVTRYNGAGVAQTTLADCAGSIATLSCVEHNVPVGTWTYAVTPKYANWTGTESAKSTPVVVAALDSAPPVTTATSTPPANAAGWHNANISVSLQSTDAATTVKQITYSATGAQAITITTVPGSSATVPTITTAGVTTLSYFAEDLLGNVETTRTLTLRLDKAIPATATLASLPSYVENGQSLSGTYADNAGGSGLASVSYYYCPSAASSCTAGNGTLIGSSSSSPYSFTWNSQPTDGSYKVVANAVDLAGNALAGNVVTTTVDNTAPAVSALSIPNTGTTGKPEQGDTIVVTFSEAPDLTTMCAGWTGTTIGATTNNDVTVTITDGGSSDPDTVAMTVGSCSGGFNFGTIALGESGSATGYITGNGSVRFRGTGSAANRSTVAWDSANLRLTIKLGTADPQNGGTAAVGAASRATYTPSSAIKDPAGHAITGTASSPAATGTTVQHF